MSAARVDKRLVWIDSAAAEDIVYFDRCPNFSLDETADSSVSALSSGLSSLQKKTYTYLEEQDGEEVEVSSEVWSLFDFDDLSNTIKLPSPGAPLSDD